MIGVKTLRRSHYMMTDTPSHFAWSESGVCNADRGQSGRRQSERGRTGARNVADNAKLLGRGANFGRTFLELGSSDFAQIFRVPGGGGPLSRGGKIPKSDEGVSRKSGPKYTTVENFNPPYLPQMGGDSPRTKFVFTRVPRPTMCCGQLGGGDPLGG